MTDLDQRIREAFDKGNSKEFVPTTNYGWFELGFKAALPRWIPVSERLPQDQMPVLIYRKGTQLQLEKDREICAILQAAWDEDKQTWYDYQDDTDIDEDLFIVTHWMPLPTPPGREG